MTSAVRQLPTPDVHGRLSLFHFKVMSLTIIKLVYFSETIAWAFFEHTLRAFAARGMHETNLGFFFL